MVFESVAEIRIEKRKVETIMAVRIAVDVGGTFTDLYAVDDEKGQQWIAKVPSSPEDSSKGIVAGVQRLLTENGVSADSVSHLIQGTTVATNAVLQRKGAKTALVTTRGFRDVLEIARQKRPHLYDLTRNKVEPLVPRRMRLEVTERVLASGKVAVPLSEEEVRSVAGKLAEEEIEAVAVCFLHSYRYPVHEQIAARILREALPGVYICCSSEVLPVFREYERMTTTVLNAYLGPIVSSYVGRIKERLFQAGVGGVVSIVQSNGGIMSAEVASQKPVYLVLSGPSSGVAGAARVSKAGGFAMPLPLIWEGQAPMYRSLSMDRFPSLPKGRLPDCPAGFPWWMSKQWVQGVGALPGLMWEVY